MAKIDLLKNEKTKCEAPIYPWKSHLFKGQLFGIFHVSILLWDINTMRMVISDNMLCKCNNVTDLYNFDDQIDNVSRYSGSVINNKYKLSFNLVISKNDPILPVYIDNMYLYLKIN